MITSDYDCLNQMNNAALDKYNQIHRRLQHVNNSVRTLNDTNCKKTRIKLTLLFIYVNLCVYFQLQK